MNEIYKSFPSNLRKLEVREEKDTLKVFIGGIVVGGIAATTIYSTLLVYFVF